MLRSARHLASRAARALSTTAPAPPSSGPNFRSVVALDGNTIRPYVQPNAHIAPDALVLGSVTCNDKAAVLAGASVRGDLGLVEVGAYTVIGEGATVMATGASGVSPSAAAAAGLPCPPDASIGDFCRIGAGAVLRSCTLAGDNVVGERAVVGRRATMGRGARLEAGAVLADDAQVPAKEVWSGNPARKVDVVSDAEVAFHYKAMEKASAVTARHAYEFLPENGTAYWEKEKLAASASA